MTQLILALATLAASIITLILALRLQSKAKKHLEKAEQIRDQYASIRRQIHIRRAK